MGNCIHHEMPQPQRMRRAPDSEYDAKSLGEETRSVASTPTTRIEVPEEDSSPNGYPTDEDKNPKLEDPKASDGDPVIEEPPPIERCITKSPEEDCTKEIIFSLDSAVPTEKQPEIVLPPATTKAGEKPTSEDNDNQKSIENLGRLEVDQSSDTDSMSSQASREVEPGAALNLEKPQKTRTSNSTFKKSTGLFLCLLGLLAGTILMNKSSAQPGIQSVLMIQTKQLPPEQCTGNDCQFLNWVNAYNGLCSLDHNGAVSDVGHTLCPSYSSNSTLPKASAPVCSFGAWLDDQNRNDECSLDVHKRFMKVWSKYTSFAKN